ncbi:hypothetical protein [Sporosarcina jiandibaonis]|uniref:hypothetical protein n=1 Tax=Sporosarcina jiandibaonis TaxID=2715535 RepID=UPI00155381D5|nr:hypothetical protein [Sporosarcina jiandibaonis]
MYVTKIYANNPINKPIPLPDSTIKKSYLEPTLKIGLAAALFTFGLDGVAFADTVIDEEARKLYYGEFIGIAKWILVGKGGWDVVHKALKDDFEGAKKSFLQYLICFAALMGLPWALGKVESIFSGMPS